MVGEIYWGDHVAQFWRCLRWLIWIWVPFSFNWFGAAYDWWTSMDDYLQLLILSLSSIPLSNEIEHKLQLVRDSSHQIGLYDTKGISTVEQSINSWISLQQKLIHLSTGLLMTTLPSISLTVQSSRSFKTTQLWFRETGSGFTHSKSLKLIVIFKVICVGNWLSGANIQLIVDFMETFILEVTHLNLTNFFNCVADMRSSMHTLSTNMRSWME